MIIHYEIHASEPATLMAFYRDLLGWQFTQQGSMDYWLIGPTPGAETSQSGVTAGLVRRPCPKPESGAAVNAFVGIVPVASVDQTLTRGTELGGEVALPKMAIPGVGWLAYLRDPDGNLFGIMQPDAQAASS